MPSQLLRIHYYVPLRRQCINRSMLSKVFFSSKFKNGKPNNSIVQSWVDKLIFPIRTGNNPILVTHRNEELKGIGITDDFLLRSLRERRIIVTRIIMWLSLVLLTPMYIFDLVMPIGPSMLPTINGLGDILLIWRLPTRRYQVGDVVQCSINLTKSQKGRGSSLNPRDEQTRWVIKRITRIEDSTEALSHQDRHVWIEGDCPEHSRDSRQFGPILESCILGKVVLRLWPFRENAWLLRPNK